MAMHYGYYKSIMNHAAYAAKLRAAAAEYAANNDAAKAELLTWIARNYETQS